MYEPRARDIDANPFDGEPEEEFLSGDAVQAVDAAVTERSGDVGIVVNLVLEFGVAGLFHRDE